MASFLEAFDIFLLEAVVNGILLGGVLALLSLGLNLIFGVIDVVWICYAELIMIGMYTVYMLHVQLGWPVVAAMAAGIAVVAVLGAVLHQFIIRPVLAAEPINQLLVTGGVLFFLQAAATLAFGIEFRNLGVKMSPMMAKAMGINAPAPNPCTPRKIINCVMFCDTPDKAEPARNSTMPPIKNHLRPQMSESLP